MTLFYLEYELEEMWLFYIISNFLEVIFHFCYASHISNILRFSIILLMVLSSLSTDCDRAELKLQIFLSMFWIAAKISLVFFEPFSRWWWWWWSALWSSSILSKLVVNHAPIRFYMCFLVLPFSYDFILPMSCLSLGNCFHSKAPTTWLLMSVVLSITHESLELPRTNLFDKNIS